MKVLTILFLIVSFPFLGFSIERELSCIIDEELENNLPTKKNIFIGKKIKIYLDKNNNWLYETKKKEWESLNSENQNLISQSFQENNGILTFIKKKYNTEKQKQLQYIDKVILIKQTMEINFLKEYYNNDIKFFSSEIRGICK